MRVMSQLARDLAWLSDSMTRERMLHLLSGEITTTSNIKHSSVLVPKDACRALTSNYSLHDTEQFRNEERQRKSESAMTCFNRRLHEIDLKSTKLYEKNSDNVRASVLLNVK